MVGHDADLTSAVWHKSSFSNTGGNCVEVARNLTGIVAVRDSKVPDAPALVLTPAQWRTFLLGVREGRHDHAAPARPVP
jgi:Domain of unknown function (DUF397)